MKYFLIVDVVQEKGNIYAFNLYLEASLGNKTQNLEVLLIKQGGRMPKNKKLVDTSRRLTE